MLSRFLLASATLGGLALVRRTPLPARRDVPAVIVARFLVFTDPHIAPNFGEVPTLLSVVGGGATLSGVRIVNTFGGRK